MMIRYMLVCWIVFCFWGKATLASDGQPNFFIDDGEVSGDAKLTGPLRDKFQYQLHTAIEKEFPCIRMTFKSQVNNMLQVVRQAQLGSSYTPATQNESMEWMNRATKIMCDTDYLLVTDVAVNPFLGKTILGVRCMKVRGQVEALVHLAEAIDIGDVGGAKALGERLAKKLIDILAYREICPYRGEIKVTVNTTEDLRREDSSPVFCNGNEGIHKTTVTQNTESNQTWTLQRTGRVEDVKGGVGEGDMQYSSHEEKEIIDENDCHPCSKSSRQGGRRSELKTSEDIAVEGISLFPDELPDGSTVMRLHAKVSLRFEKDGTYYVGFNATTKKGTVTRQESEDAEGTCDNVHRKGPVKKSEWDLPLQTQGQGWGPFTGSPFDKGLHLSFEMPDEVTGDGTTEPRAVKKMQVELDLSRD